MANTQSLLRWSLISALAFLLSLAALSVLFLAASRFPGLTKSIYYLVLVALGICARIYIETDIGIKWDIDEVELRLCLMESVMIRETILPSSFSHISSDTFIDIEKRKASQLLLKG